MNAHAAEEAKAVAAAHDQCEYESGVDLFDEGSAEDYVCRDACEVACWLESVVGAGERYPFCPSTPACWIDFDAHPTGRLLTLAFDPGQPEQTRIFALDEIRSRYLEAHEAEVSALVGTTGEAA